MANSKSEAYEGRSLVNSEDEIDEDVLEETIQKAQRFWATTPDHTLFWGTSNIENEIPPGLYKCITTNETGPAFKKLIVSTDDLIRFPDAACEEVIREIEQFWRMEAKFKARGYLHKRGILMYGDPGSGKTSTIQQLIALILERGGISVYADDPHLLSSCLQMLRRIEPKRPVIVILEDFETLTDQRGRENEWLSVLDGEAQINNVVFLATTNYIQKLDKRFTDRPSRFDVIKKIPMPSARSRAMYLAAKEPSLDRAALEEWVLKSKSFSIAHLKEMSISVMCYGKSLEETEARLRDMQRRKFTNDNLAYNPDKEGGGGFGFASEGNKEDAVSDEEFNWDLEWDDVRRTVKEHAAAILKWGEES